MKTSTSHYQNHWMILNRVYIRAFKIIFKNNYLIKLLHENSEKILGKFEEILEESGII